MNSQIPSQEKTRQSFRKSFFETTRAFGVTERLVFWILLAVVVITGLTLISRVNNRFLIAVPDHGGTISEGIIGVPRFVNPVLSISDADKDMTTLVFSGLLKATAEGELTPDLSKEYTISGDGRTYSFTLRDNIFFHDGSAVTADDVEFTIQRIQDPMIRSPKRPIWDGVSIHVEDPTHISFTLRQPYAPFIENFTLGILPKHVWQDVPSDQFSFSELNVEAVGSGPYKVNKVKRNSVGLVTFYTLRSYKNYALGEPFVKYLELSFFQNERELLNAFAEGDVEAMSSVSPMSLRNLDLPPARIATSTLPRVFGAFFNQNQAAVFLNKEVRVALDQAINKDRIVREVFSNYAKPINSPVPYSTSTLPTATTELAVNTLTKAGWILNKETGIMEKKSGTVTTPLSFSLSTGDALELKQVAEFLKEDWEKIGASVDIKVFEIGDLNQNVIRPRKFDALLFGEVVGREFDLYPFWHSSQRNDPGLNIALYANISADKILEEIRGIQDRSARRNKALEFEKLIKTEMPATFIYAPYFVYVIPKDLQNVDLGNITNPGERFLNVHEWFIETNNVWKIFAY